MGHYQLLYTDIKSKQAVIQTTKLDPRTPSTLTHPPVSFLGAVREESNAWWCWCWWESVLASTVCVSLLSTLNQLGNVQVRYIIKLVNI